eukprot:4449218-Prorocentrum_lima.AAC.1
MTSSLVGSEMCIRDRRKDLRLGPWPREELRLGTWPREEQRLGTWPKAVSYTHLTLPTICSV